MITMKSPYEKSEIILLLGNSYSYSLQFKWKTLKNCQAKANWGRFYGQVSELHPKGQRQKNDRAFRSSIHRQIQEF